MIDELAGLIAPRDPRADLPVPAFGSMPRQARLDELVVRVLAPNPSMMTLDGTNTYLIGEPDSGQVAIVDPGPPAAEHFRRVEQALADAGAECRWILVTHHHLDHAEAASEWAQRFGATVGARAPDVAGPTGRLLSDGEEIQVGPMKVRVVPTPGHCSDHLAFRLESGAVLVGDHILGRGSSIITYPEGDLLAYLDSLRRVLDLGPSVLYPGHGPEMAQDPSAVVNYYLEHRLFRERQILAVLGRGHADPAALVRRIYADVATDLWPAAEQSTRTALEKLRVEGVVELGNDGVARLASNRPK